MEEVDYHMTDMEETESIADQSLIILGSGQTESKANLGNLKIFTQFDKVQSQTKVALRKDII